MKNQTSFREYTRSDFIRAGAVAVVWVLFYVFLATHPRGPAAQAEKMATAAASGAIARDAVNPPGALNGSGRGR